MFSIRGFAILVTAIGAAASAAAQPGTPGNGVPGAEIGIDYSYVRANATPGQCGCFGLNGGSVEGAMRAYRNFSVVADIAGAHAGTTSVAGQSLSLVFYTGGARFSYPIHRSPFTIILPFAQGLIGGVHGFDAPFPNTVGALSNSANALALWAGGGIDIAVGDRFAIRAVQVDYGYSHLPNNANHSENLLRVSTGVVLRVK